MGIKVVVLAAMALTLFGATGALADGSDPAAYAFILSGLVVYDDGDGRAWIQEKTLTQNQVVVLKRGQSVGPWKLTRIMPGRVELDGPSGKISVLLSDGSGGGTRSAAVGAPAPSAPATPPAVATPHVQPAISGGAPATPGAAAPRIDTHQPASVPAAAPPANPAPTQPASTQHQGNAAQPPATTTPPAVRDSTQASSQNQNGLFFPVGDPRRRENLKQFFGGGQTR